MAMTLVALVLVAALNPLVVRSPEPRGNVPADCEVSGAPATPRVAVAQEPAEPPPPPRQTTTRAQAQYDLGPLQRALATNNRPAFDAELARAREAGAPTRVYEDVARLWDAQFDAPFFAEGSEPHRIASQYPGYEAAVREQIFTDASGRKFYPAAESRAFVARQTGANLPASTRTQTRATPQQPSTRTTTQQPSTRATTHQPRNPATQQPRNPETQQPRNRTTRQSTPTPRTPATPQPNPPVARRQTASPRRSPDPPAAQPPAATVSAPVVPPVEHTSSTAAPPAAGSLPPDAVATTTTSAPPAVETAATGTTATGVAATDTTVTNTATTAADTATTTAATATTGTTAQRGRSIILPSILILIGLGVLILLFKAK